MQKMFTKKIFNIMHGKLYIAVLAIFEWSQGHGIVFNTVQRESWLQVYA